MITIYTQKRAVLRFQLYRMSPNGIYIGIVLVFIVYLNNKPEQTIKSNKFNYLNCAKYHREIWSDDFLYSNSCSNYILVNQIIDENVIFFSINEFVIMSIDLFHFKKIYRHVAISHYEEQFSAEYNEQDFKVE